MSPPQYNDLKNIPPPSIYHHYYGLGLGDWVGTGDTDTLSSGATEKISRAIKELRCDCEVESRDRGHEATMLWNRMLPLSLLATQATSSARTIHKQARILLSKMGMRALRPLLIEREDGLRVWRSPPVSRRRARELRKIAIREGSYGTFNKETLRGWERSWDIQLAMLKPAGQGRIRIRPNKGTKSQRTREERAQKIEKAMEGMDDRIEEYYHQKHASKPPRSFESYYKTLVKRSKKMGWATNTKYHHR